MLFVDEDDIATLVEQFLGKAGSNRRAGLPDRRHRGGGRLDAGAVADGSLLPALRSTRATSRSCWATWWLCLVVAARRQAAEHAGTLDDELALLVVHGVLHVLGHDHAEPDQAERMRARELEPLEAHHSGGPAPAAFRQEHVEP